MPLRTFIAGLYYGPNTTGTETADSLAQGWEYASRFDVGVTTPFDRIGVNVSAGAVNARYRLGIRMDTGKTYPGTLILEAAGTIDASSAGFKELPIFQQLNRGRYWVTATAQVAEASLWVRSLDPLVGQSNPNLNSIAGYAQDAGAGALPAAFSEVVTTIGTAPKILLRAANV